MMKTVFLFEDATVSTSRQDRISQQIVDRRRIASCHVFKLPDASTAEMNSKHG
jgi:hypothetical protein